MYNSIIVHLILLALMVVSSMVHLKMNSHMNKDKFTTFEDDLEAFSLCFLASLKFHKGKEKGN